MKTKTLLYHKKEIKKACAALVKDGYDRNQTIGAVIEFFLSDKNNSIMFDTVLKSYLAILQDDTLMFGKKFRPRFPSTKPLIAAIKKGRK